MKPFSRRQFFLAGSAGAIGVTTGCGTGRSLPGSLSGYLLLNESIEEGSFRVVAMRPDGTGRRLLLDRQVQARAIATEKLGPLDRLTHVGKFGMGALVYEPSEPHLAKHSNQLDLDLLAEESTRISEGEVEQISTELFELSGSSAGARPKIMVGISEDSMKFIHGQQELPPGFEHWMIKFTSSQDRRDSGNIEYAYSLMARASGIEMMPTQRRPNRRTYSRSTTSSYWVQSTS